MGNTNTRFAVTRSKTLLFVLVCAFAVFAICVFGTTRAFAIDTTIDTTDDAYVSEAGSGVWTTEHDAIYQTYVGDTLDMRSDMNLTTIYNKMLDIETGFPLIDTSQISLLNTASNLTVTINVPKGLEFNVSSVYMEDNALYKIDSTSTTGTVVGPGSFTINMSLKKSFTSYNDLKATIGGLPACNMGTTVPPDGFTNEIRVHFPGVKVNGDMVNNNVAVGMGTMTGAFSSTASMYGGFVTVPFSFGLSSHQYPGGVDAALDPASAITSVTVKVSPAAKVTVTKTWDHGAQAEANWPAAATVHLFADGVEVDKATLTAANSWTNVFDGLDPSKTYTVTEDAVTDYAATVGATTGTATDGYSVNISNAFTGTVPSETTSNDAAPSAPAATPSTGDGMALPAAVLAAIAGFCAALGFGVRARSRWR